MGEGFTVTRTRKTVTQEPERALDHYDSMQAVIDRLQQPRSKGAGERSEEHEAYDKWDLSLGYEGAMAAYCGGWAEGAQRAELLARTLTVTPTATRRLLSPTVAGSVPNVGAYLAGSPQSMYRITRTNTRSVPLVHLVPTIGYAARIAADTAFDRGCAMVALIDALERAGCRVAVTLAISSDPHGNEAFVHTLTMAIKRYEQRLDLDQVIFTTAHPAFFRRLVFGLYERTEHEQVIAATRAGTYGTPKQTTAADLPAQPLNVHQVIIPALSPDSVRTTPEQYLADIVAALPEVVRAMIE